MSILIKNSRDIFFLTATFFYLLVVLALHPIYSADYFGILGSGNPIHYTIRNDLLSGRFFSAFLAWLPLDPFENYPLYVAATAVFTGVFMRRLYINYFNFENSLLLFSFFVFSFFWSGSMFDLLSYREVPHHTLAIFALAYAFLVLEDWPAGIPRTTLRVLVVVFLFGTYQPAVVMVVVLSLLKSMFDTADDVNYQIIIRRSLNDALTILLGMCFYIAAYVTLKDILPISVENTGRKILDFGDPNEVSKNLNAYISALWSLFKTPSTMYAWSHIGLGLSATFLAFLIYTLYSNRHRFLSACTFGLLAILCFQDPANAIVESYWPALRSSFYVALVPGLMVAYLYSRATHPAFRKTCPYVLASLFSLYAMAGFVVIKDVYDIRGRDYLLAREIANIIKSDPRLASGNGIRFSTNGDRINRAYYRGPQNARFEFGTPLMAVPWSVSPYFRHVTGLDLQYKGDAICESPADTPPRLDITIQDGVLNVCY